MSRTLVIMIPQSLAVIWALSIRTIECVAVCGDKQVEVDALCCNLCPPGTHVKKYCSEHQQTVCSPCEEKSFSDHYNLFDRCEECRSCQQKHAEQCTLTKNANCSCDYGFLCSNNVCSECEQNKCVTGETLTSTASSWGGGLIKYTYQCEPLCLDNTYFDVKERICKTHTGGIDSIRLILGTGFVLLSLTILVFLSHVCIKNLWKHRVDNNPTEVLAVCTNTSDFHLSKEESGLELIMNDKSKNNSFGPLHLEEVATC